MIITCPNCETRFNLPDEKIPAGGAKVKCSKCAQVFKTELPPSSPEEEVEALLDEETVGADTQAGDDFDETFDDVAAGAEAAEESVDEPIDEPVDEPAPEEPAADEAVEEGMPDMDDLFDDEAPADEPAEETPADEEEEDIFASDEETGDLFEDEVEDDGDDDVGDLFDDDDDEVDEAEEDQGDLFADDDDLDEAAEDESDDEDDLEDEGGSDSMGSLDDDLSLDSGPEKGSRKSLGCLIILLLLAVGLGAAVYFKVWTYAGINLGDMLKNVPFVGQLFMEETGGEEEAAPGESPAERVRKIELKNVKQYYVPNEKVGNLFVVEGKAVNKFAKPKERIKVEVILYDATNNVLTSQAFLCGNVLSQFQLQVQTENEIKDGLASEVGILSNNTFIRPGASTPFMAVFFDPPTNVKEFMVKVVDVGDPE